MAYQRLTFLSDELKARFWAKVDIRREEECWNWNAAKNRGGYGVINLSAHGIRATLATHISLRLDGRNRPNGACALHSCDNRSCVNPAHLRWGTHKENEADKYARGRAPSTERRRAFMKGRYCVGEKVGSARLTEADVKAIRDDTRYQRVIAEEYGVHQMTVSDIKTGKTWKHIA